MGDTRTRRPRQLAVDTRDLTALRDPQRRVAAAAELLDQLRLLEDYVTNVRDAAMCGLRDRGWTYEEIAAIAAIANVTRGRVAQIVSRINADGHR